MRFNQFRFIIPLFTIILLSSCLGTNTPTTVSSDRTFVSLTFATNDSIPYISTAKFTLNADSMTIVNVDSLPYKTRIDSVYPTFTFKSSSRATMFFPVGYKYKKDSAVITGKDTVDFSNLTQPIRVRNYAADGKIYKDYFVKVNVHQVDPELYIWNNVTGDIDSHSATSQKAITVNDTIFYYLNNATNAYLYKSTDGKTWSELALTNFPANTPLNDIQWFNGKLFFTQDGDISNSSTNKIYSSSNSRDWTAKSSADYNYTSLLFILNNKLWAIMQSKADLKYHLANSTDGDIWSVLGEISADFPVREFASLTFLSRTGRPKVIVTGGISQTNEQLKTNWSTLDGINWIDFSIENHSLDTLALGASIISYDEKLLLFGLRSDNSKSHYKVSKDEGLSWQIPDSTYNYLPKDFESRNYQSVVVYKPRTYSKYDTKQQDIESNRIYIIGGKTPTSVIKSDVWTGKLNRKNFLIQ